MMARITYRFPEDSDELVPMHQTGELADLLAYAYRRVKEGMIKPDVGIIIEGHRIEPTVVGEFFRAMEKLERSIHAEIEERISQ